MRAVILFFVLSIPILCQNSNSMFYPLSLGNKWEYIDLVYALDIDTLYTTKEVIGDSILPNGINYFVTKEWRGNWSNIRFERFDTLANEIKYYEDDFCDSIDVAIYSLDYSRDSTEIWYQCGVIPHFISYDDTTKSEDSAYINIDLDHFWVEHSVFQRNLGLTYRLINEGGQSIKKLIGAKINGNIWGVITNVKKDNDLMKDFKLHQNYPNPFNPSTSISYSIQQSGYVQLKVYDMLGREVANLVNKEQNVGNYKIEFNGSTFASGIYFYRLQSGSFVETKKLVLLR